MKIRDILKKKDLKDNADVELEKGDFLAMMIALAYYMVPALLGIFLFIALLVWVIF